MVTGLVTQGGENPDDVVMVTSFLLRYGASPDSMLTYEETHGVIKVRHAETS